MKARFHEPATAQVTAPDGEMKQALDEATGAFFHTSAFGRADEAVAGTGSRATQRARGKEGLRGRGESSPAHGATAIGASTRIPRGGALPDRCAGIREGRMEGETRGAALAAAYRETVTDAGFN